MHWASILCKRWKMQTSKPKSMQYKLLQEHLRILKIYTKNIFVFISKKYKHQIYPQQCKQSYIKEPIFSAYHIIKKTWAMILKNIVF